MNAKTLFATLAATSMFAVSGAITTPEMGFEGLALASSVTNLVESENRYFLYNGTEDESVVSNIVEGTTYSNVNGFPGTFADQGDNYLSLSTGDGTLYRASKALSNGAFDGGEPFDTAKLFVDTLVQFTVTEDEEPTTESGDKLAIWLNTNNTLCVKAGYIVKDENTNTFALDDDPKTYELSGTVTPGTWYRLTVEAIGNVGDTEIAGFKIYIDGSCVGTATAAANYDVTAMKESDSWIVFPSIVNNKYLTAVGFRGTGAVDDLVITENRPNFLPAETIDFTLTWDANVTALNFYIDEELVSDPEWFTSGVAGSHELSVAPDAQISIFFAEVEGFEPVVASGTQAWTNSNEISATLLDGSYYTYEFTSGGGTIALIYEGGSSGDEDWVDDPDTEITAGETAADAYPTLASSALATADAQKLTTWAKGNGVSFADVAAETGADSTLAKAFMLNCANTAKAVEEAEGDFKDNISIAMVNGVLKVSCSGTYNVTPQLQGHNNITASTGWTDVEAASTDYPFYKYVLRLPAASAGE